MDAYVSHHPIGPVYRPEHSIAKANCEQCTAEVPVADMHRLEAQDQEVKLCGNCCPNCWGGVGKGPK